MKIVEDQTTYCTAKDENGTECGADFVGGICSMCHPDCGDVSDAMALRYIKEKLGLNTDDIAAICKMNRRTVARYVSGAKEIPAPFMEIMFWLEEGFRPDAYPKGK